MIIRTVGIRIWNRETFRHLLQHGKTHGDMKPVDDMLCPRVQPLGPRPYRVAAIGDESDGLMVYDALRFQDSPDSGTSVAVEAVNERKAA
jgi:hypothetical protein